MQSWNCPWLHRHAGLGSSDHHRPSEPKCSVHDEKLINGSWLTGEVSGIEAVQPLCQRQQPFKPACPLLPDFRLVWLQVRTSLAESPVGRF